MKLDELRNEKHRTEFLDDHTNVENGWILWAKNELINRKIWRYNLPDGSSIFAEDELITYRYPDEHTEWHTFRWYFRTLEQDVSGVPFADSMCSKSMIKVRLKELQYK